MPPGWNILNDTSYTDGLGRVHVLGELYNNTESNQQDVLVTISFYNDQNLQIAEEVTAPVVQVVPQGNQVPFSLETELRFSYVRYEVSVDGEMTGLQPRQDLEILNHTGNPGAPYHITGEIRNSGEALSTYAQVIATLYDGAGQVVGVGYDFLPAGSLGPGQTAPFEVIIEQPHEGIVSYALMVLGF